MIVKEFGGGDAIAKEIVEEIQNFGILKLSQLDKIIPKDFEDNVRKLKLHPKLTFASLIRSILLINDAKKYFEHSWHKHWNFLRKDAKRLLNKYNVDLVYVRKHVGLNT